MPNELEKLLTEAGIPEDKIEEALELAKKLPTKMPDKLPESNALKVLEFRRQIDEENDWLKKSVLAARLASLNLSTD